MMLILDDVITADMVGGGGGFAPMKYRCFVVYGYTE